MDHPSRSAPFHKMVLEVCVDHPKGLRAALSGGADRIELCSDLSVGGLTPTAGIMALAASLSDRPVHCLIRPRTGGFDYNPDELSVMVADIQQARHSGLTGVVIGALNADGLIAVEPMQRMVEAAGEMDITFHRAFDLIEDQFAALDQLAALGIRRILTSGGEQSAIKGIEQISKLSQEAGDRIAIMPGGGINQNNAHKFLALGIRELHASCSETIDVRDARLLAFGFQPDKAKDTCVDKVKALRTAMGAFTAA